MSLQNQAKKFQPSAPLSLCIKYQDAKNNTDDGRRVMKNKSHNNFLDADAKQTGARGYLISILGDPKVLGAEFEPQ